MGNSRYVILVIYIRNTVFNQAETTLVSQDGVLSLVEVLSYSLHLKAAAGSSLGGAARLASGGGVAVKRMKRRHR